MNKNERKKIKTKFFNIPKTYLLSIMSVNENF